MNNDIDTEIPNFESPEYEDLLNALLTGTCIFIGAGISKLAGYKTWEELLKEIVLYFWDNRKALPLDKRRKFDWSFCTNLQKHHNIVEAFDYLYLLDSNMFISGIKSIFSKDQRMSSNKVFEIISKLHSNKNIFVTTNIDMGLQNYLGLKDERVSIYPIFCSPPNLINYLHGRIDKEKTWILTRGQYNKGYVVDGAPCVRFLKHIFLNYNVLFIGYGLKEEDIIRQILLTAKKRVHWWLEGFDRNSQDPKEIRSTSLRENYNIHCIPYSIDYEEHKTLYEVLQNLYEILLKRRS